MIRTKPIVAAMSMVGGAALSAAPPAAPPPTPRPAGTTGTDLQRHDLSSPGREMLQARVDFAPGAAFPRHSHPGEEIIYVLQGTLEYEVAGKPVTLNAGEVLFVPKGTVHAARNVGTGPAAEFATYVLVKGKPLTVLAK
ncbi:MAG: cupin domain-containing protein [Sphingomicrobium sp.]